jgi:hypothetical protein
LNEEEAFWLARRRVGKPQQLAEEFGKVDPAKIWRERVFWMWTAIFLSDILSTMTRSLTFALSSKLNRPASSFSMQPILQMIVLVTSIVIPLILSILLVNGKLVPPLSKLLKLVKNRRHLAIAATIGAAGSSAVYTFSYSIYFSKMFADHSFYPLVWQMMVPSFCYSFIVGLTLVLFMPPHNGGKGLKSYLSL